MFNKLFLFFFGLGGWDLAVFAGFTALFVISLVIQKYDRIINSILSIYVTAALVEGLPASKKILLEINPAQDPNYALKMMILGLLTIAVFVLVSWGVAHRSALRGQPINWFSDWWKILLLGFAQAGLVFSITLGYLDALLASYISWSVRKLFISGVAKAIWFISPIVILIIVSKLSAPKDSDAARGDHH